MLYSELDAFVMQLFDGWTVPIQFEYNSSESVINELEFHHKNCAARV